MNKQNDFDELFESAMRQEPQYLLPVDFMKGVSAQVARKMAFRVQLKMMAGYAIILGSLLVLMFGGNYIIENYLPKYSSYIFSLSIAGVLALLVLFVTFMDRVVLSYLESRFQH